MEGRKGVREVEVEVEGGSTQPGPTFSFVCATPLLQHQAQLGVNPAVDEEQFWDAVCWIDRLVLPAI